MKKTLIIIPLLLFCFGLQAQHIFKNIKENKLQNGEWIGWGTVSSKIKVNITENGIYELTVYENKKYKQTIIKFKVKYCERDKESRWYSYDIIKYHQNGKEMSLAYYYPRIIKSQIPLSKMAQGHEGVINLFINESAMGWICRNY